MQKAEKVAYMTFELDEKLSEKEIQKRWNRVFDILLKNEKGKDDEKENE